MTLQMDWDRRSRTGVAEAVMCEWKTDSQIAAAIAAARAEHKPLLLTRLPNDALDRLPLEQRRELDYDPVSLTAFFGEVPMPLRTGAGVVTAGESDLRVASEAARTLHFGGHAAEIITDVGVAGMWRLTARLTEIRDLKVVIAVAGMEGALFSVLAGLVSAPIIAVPTSIGYGVAEGGKTALAAALASCAPGIAVVNIDSGYAAATNAIKILNVAGGEGARE